MTSKSGYPVPDAKLQIANGYNLEFDTMSRLLDMVCRDEHGHIPINDLASAMGVADRQAKHLSALANVLGLLQQKTYKPTVLGKLIKENDPFFDDVGTLWILHYIIASDPRAIIWNRAINKFIPKNTRFKREALRDSFLDLKEWFSEYSLQAHVLKEINTFLDAYTNQSFARLFYLRVDGDWYSRGYCAPIPSLVLAACIAHFRSDRRASDTAVSIPDLCAVPNGPGMVFQLSEDRLRVILEELKTQPGISLESRADLDQLRISPDLTDIEFMKRYYDNR